MCAKSKVLWFVSFPALLLGLLVLTWTSAKAVITQQERDECMQQLGICNTNCANSAKECGKQWDTCLNDCNDKCQLQKENCLDKANQTSPKVPKTKVQPKVKPGGAETPGTESPNVQPKGGIPRY